MQHPVPASNRFGSRTAGLTLVLAVALLVLAAPAQAQKSVTLTFKGSLLNSLGGACATSIYNTKCPSGACACQKYVVDADTKSNKATGKLIGKATTAELDVTLDGGSDFVGTGGFGNCRPFFATLVTTGGIDQQQLDMTGTTCSPLKAKSVIDSLAGGYGITNSVAGHQGFGKLTGTINEDTGAIVVKFTGPAN